jgi:hypothetical protein
MSAKASAEARERCIAAMIEAASLYVDPYAQILALAPDDAAWLAQRELELRQRLEALSDSMLEHERLRLSTRLGEEIGASLFEHEPSDKAVLRRRSIMGKVKEELQKHPTLTAQSLYRRLRLHAPHKGGTPRMEREEFHSLFLAAKADLGRKMRQ